MCPQISLQRTEIAERALGFNKLKVHQGAGRIVDEDEQGAGRSAILEPVMIRAINLDQLAITFPAQTRLVERAALLPRQPNPRVLHPFAQRLARDLQPVILLKLLSRKCRPEVDVVLANQRHRELPDRRIDPVVRCTAARLVPDCGWTVALELPQKAGEPVFGSTPRRSPQLWPSSGSGSPGSTLRPGSARARSSKPIPCPQLSACSHWGRV
jgi:hypothetical protein